MKNREKISASILDYTGRTGQNPPIKAGSFARFADMMEEKRGGPCHFDGDSVAFVAQTDNFFVKTEKNISIFAKWW